MRFLATAAVLLATGLASVHAQNNNANNATATTTAAAEEGTGSSATATTTASSETGTATGINLADILNLGSGGANLADVNIGNQLDLANAIGLLMNNLCIGNLFNLNNILGLGGNQELELLLSLGQINQLVSLGFLNVFDVQSLFASAFVGNGFAGIGNGFNNAFVGGGLFNFGVFKRELEARKKNLKRTRLRRNILGKRQCQVADLSQLEGIDVNDNNNNNENEQATSTAEAAASATAEAEGEEETKAAGQRGAEGRRRRARGSA